MAEEKVTKGTETKGTEVKEEKVVEPAEVNSLLRVEREKFVSTKDKKEYWSYFVKGTLKNKRLPSQEGAGCALLADATGAFLTSAPLLPCL